MPFIQDYECEAGHRQEHMHMGSRATAPEKIVCSVCEPVCLIDAAYEERLSISDLAAIKPRERFAYPVISMSTPPQTIVRGNGDFSDRERERLTKRSNDHWRTKGLEEARANVEKVVRQYRKTAEESHGSQ